MPYDVIEKITLEDVTTGVIDGDGNFDKLMKTVALHTHEEYKSSRIRGVEYSTIYLGAMQMVLDAALKFTLEIDKSWLEAEILRLQAEKLEIEKVKVQNESDLIAAQIPLIQQQTINAVKEGIILDKQACKLDAEFDVLMETKLKLIQETLLLLQKTATEKAQTSGAAIETDSVLGKQIALYTAQRDGFHRDAEQKAADIFTKTWSVRRTTNEDTEANNENKLWDPAIGEAMDLLLAGIRSQG